MSSSLPPDDNFSETTGAGSTAPTGTRRAARRSSIAPPGGHGSRWIVTYSDMVTLLIAFFIAIITFSSKHIGGRDAPKGESPLAGLGGSGLAGPKRSEDIPRDAVVWRLRFRQGPKTETGSEFAPLYHDPALETTEGVLRAFSNAPPGKIGDPYTLHLPFGILFGSKSSLTPSGIHLLRTIAANLRNMPYDFHLSVRSPDHLSRAVQMGTYLSTSGGIHPGRIAIGVRAGDGDELDTVLLEVTPQV